MDHYLRLAGLRILLRAPFALRPHACLRPFLTDTGSEQAWDIRYTLLSNAERQAFPADAHCIFSDRRMRISQYSGGKIWQFSAWAADPSSPQNPLLLEIAPNDFLLFFPEQQLARLADASDFTNFLALEAILARFDRLFLHSSVVLWQGKALAFCAASGVGKSTHAALWASHLGVDILNGDRCLLEPVEGGFLAHGSPCAGSSGIYRRDCAPLAGIFLLQQAQENQVRRVSQAEAFRALLQQSVIIQWEEALTARACDLLLRLTQCLPVWQLSCRPDPEAALLARETAFPSP